MSGDLSSSTHTKDPLHYDERDDPKVCIFTNDKTTCPRVTACYSNDDEYPNDNQFCGYLKDGTLFAAPGCCNPVCPSEHCPVLKNTKHDPPAQVPPGTVKPKKNDTKVKAEPFPKLLKMLLIILAILLVSAGIFISVG